MLICEVVLPENYAEELVQAVQDLLSQMMSKDIKKMSTDRFMTLLAKQGYITSMDELIQAVDASGFASSVDQTEIVPASELPGDIDTDPEQTVDVGDLAGGQAMKDIKAGL